MKLKNKNKAFTLIELLVWISIISIIILWSTSIDYNRLSIKQKTSIFSNSIKSNFETIRNNALTWKWIWINLDVPKNIKIEYSNTSTTGSLSVTSSIDWIIWTPYIYDSINFEEGYNIWTMNCLQLDWSTDSVITWWTWTIIFEWINITLTWACINNEKILEIPIRYRSETKILHINVVNWLTEFK